MRFGYFVRRELVRRRLDVVAYPTIGVAVGLLCRGADRWERLLAEGVGVTVLAALHAVRGVAEDRPALPVGPSLLVTAVGAATFLLAVAASSPGSPTLAGLEAGAMLWLWSVAVASGAEAAGQRFGPGATALGVTALPASGLLAAPLLGSALFPTGASLALAVSPVIVAGRALGIEVAKRPLLYDLSSLGVVEFRYPAYPLHAVLAAAFAVAFARRAVRRRRLR